MLKGHPCRAPADECVEGLGLARRTGVPGDEVGGAYAEGMRGELRASFPGDGTPALARMPVASRRMRRSDGSSLEAGVEVGVDERLHDAVEVTLEDLSRL